MLYWNVNSDFDGEAKIQITYFTSGITWSADYQCTATGDEGHVNLNGFVRITNNSGEEYENAQVRLVVGTINLVQKIAELAKIRETEVQNLDEANRRDLRHAAAKETMTRMEFESVGSLATTPPDVSSAHDPC